MSKPTITKLFVGGILAVVAGLVLGVIACVFAIANNVFVMNGPDVTGITSGPATWTMLSLGILAVLALVGGATAGLVAWIGALINTAQLEDKVWFILLLVLGLLSFGFFAMIAYVIAGPDGTLPQNRRPVQLAS
jgi:H+/Cl- antiporter ClcA